MKIERGFLLSLYVNLALAVACLAYVTAASYATAALILGGPFVALFLLAYYSEGRWTLNTFWSTVIPLFVAAGAGLYFGDSLIHVRQIASTIILTLERSPPFLFVALIAILFRPKTVVIYWMLQGLGFTMAILAAALESDFLLGFLLAAYLVSSLWTLGCFFLYREQNGARRPGRATQPEIAADSTSHAGLTPSRSPGNGELPWRWLGVPQAVRRALAISLAAVVLYVLTPRQPVGSVEETLFRSPLLQSGLGDALIDLNRGGTIRSNRAVAFEVEAHSAVGQPKLDLDPNTRWRAKVLTHYEGGRWQVPAGRPRPLARLDPADTGGLPDLGPDQYNLTFHFPARLKRLPVVAEPIAAPPGGAMPIIFTFRSGTNLPAVWHSDGELGGPPELHERRYACNTYRQAMLPGAKPELALPREPDAAYIDYHCQAPELPGLKAWSDQLLERFVEEQRLNPADIRPDAGGRLPAASHEKVARVLEAYLVASGEFTYSLELARDDRRADPVVDFLCNVKQGHCERFASGLALMLRAQGVPARIVTGFRGAENLNNGWYHVRHSHAHSWVEVLVQRRVGEWQWLSFDPTPGDDQANAGLTGLGRWWREFRQGGGSFWRNYVVEFGGEEQATLTTDVLSRLGMQGQTPAAKPAAPEPEESWTALPWAAALSIAVGLVLLVRRLRRWRQAPPSARPQPELAFYFRFLKLLARRCDWEPGAAQTALEFARTIAERLCKNPATAPLAHVPLVVVQLFYHARYSGRPLTEEQVQTIETQLAALDQILREWDRDLGTVANEPARA